MFQPRSPLEETIRRGDPDAALALLRAQPPAERHGHRAGLMQMLKLLRAASYGRDPGEWGEAPTDAQRRGLALAVTLCGTAKDVVEAWVDDDLLVALGQEFHPRSLDGLAEAKLKHSPQSIRSVQRLIAAGLALRPEGDDYALGLMTLPRVGRGAVQLSAMFEADPGLRPALLRVFDVEGTSEVSLASSDKYNHDPALAWGTLLLSLVDHGHATRELLLDRTLGVLEKDWPQHRAGWFSRFHAELAPDVASLQSRLPRYLGLCSSRIAPTVTLALDVLRQVDAARPIDGAALLGALRPVMASAVKAQLEAALKLLDGVVKRESALALQASEVAAMGLLHEAAPVQASVLKRLEAWGVDDALRRRLAEHAPAIAATNAAKLARLMQEGDLPVAVAVEPAPAADEPAHAVDPLDADRALPPVADFDELVECIAHVFAHGHDVDAFERAITALVAAAPIADADKPLFAPVRKRAARQQKLLPRELARLLLFVLDGTRSAGQAGRDHGGNESAMDAVLIRRVDDLMAIAAQGRGLVPLSSPTHRGGFIAAEALVARVAAHHAAGLVSSEAEQVTALLRLAPGAAGAAATLPDIAFTRALRYALGEAVAPGPEAELFAAAARIRHPRGDDAELDRLRPSLGPDAALPARYTWQVESRSHEYDGMTYAHHDLLIEVQGMVDDVPAARLAVRRHPPPGEIRRYYRWWSFSGIDEGAIRCMAALLPSDPEAFFAEGARAIGNNLDWGEAQWQNRAYLELLLDPVTAMTPMACLLLALALAGKEPGQTAIAVDALVHARAQGRLGVGRELADTLRSLLATPLLKPTRLCKSLQAALRADPRCNGLVFELLCAAVQARPKALPRDQAALLDMLLELKTRDARELPVEVREALSEMKLGGNARALQRKLLA